MIFSTNLSKTFLILRKIQRDTVNVSNSIHVKHPLFLSHANQIRIFSIYFRKIIKYKLSLISVHWKASCSRERTDMTKLIISFRNVENAPKNGERAENICRHRTMCVCVCVYIYTHTHTHTHTILYSKTSTHRATRPLSRYFKADVSAYTTKMSLHKETQTGNQTHFTVFINLWRTQ